MKITLPTVYPARHSLAGEPIEPVGYRADGRPIWPVFGAADDDEDEDDDFEDDPGADDGGEDDGDDDDDDPKDAWKPPSKDEWEAQQSALARANKQARDRRLRIKELEKGIPPAGKDGKPDPKAEERLRAEIEESVVGTWKPLVVNSAAKTALSEAGLIGKPDRLLKLIDLDEIDVDPDTGDVDGLSEQVADLKKDYPHLFRKKGRVLDAADRGERGSRGKMSATELQAAALRGEL